MKIRFFKKATVNPLFIGLPEDKATDLTHTLKGSNILLLQLRKILEKRITDARHINPKDVENPNWAINRAFKDGQLQALEDFYNWLHTN
jgi:hypothetical protein